MPFASTEEAVEYAKVNVMYNESIILYVIKIPLTNEKIYENIKLYPVGKNKKFIKLSFKEIIKNGNEMYGIKDKCLRYNSVNICNHNQLINLRNNTCIPNIVKSLPSSCTYSNGQHIPPIETLSPGLILFNGYNGTVLIDNVEHHLSGTFLIKFTNTTIVAQNKVYRNWEAPQMETIPTILQPTPLEKNLENLLTIESLNELHLNNTREIGMIRVGTMVNGVSSVLFLLLIVVIGFVLSHVYRSSQGMNVSQIRMEDAYVPHAPAVILNNIQSKDELPLANFRVNNIPYL